MTINYPHFFFASPPRTGTTWVRKACSLAGLGSEPPTYVHIPHDPGTKGLTVTMVRHPCDWLISYWSALKGGRIGVKEVDRLADVWCSSFDDFIRSYLREMPGQVYRMFESYNADTYLRVNELPWCFMDLLESCQIPHKLLKNVRALEPQNVNYRRQLNSTHKIQWSPSLYDRVVEAEGMMFTEYDV